MPKPEPISILGFSYWFLLWTQGPLTQLLLSRAGRVQTVLSMVVGPMFLFLALITSPFETKHRRWPRKATWIFVYLGWMGLSLLWTYASGRLFATAVFLAHAADVVAVALLCRMTSGFRSALKGIIAGSCALALILGVELAVNPDVVALTHLGAQEDTAVNPNLFGYRIALGALACLFLYLNGAKRVLPLALLLTTALFATTSKTSIGLFLIIGFIYLLSARVKRRMKIAIGSVVGLATCLALPFALRYFLVYDKKEMAGNLTGRLPLWETIIGLIADRPILGYGFFSVKEIANSSWGAMHSHNDILQQWVTLGIPGLLLAVLLYMLVWRHLRRSTSRFATLGLLWLVFAIGHGFIDSDMISLGFPLQMMLLFFYPLPLHVPGATNRKRRRKMMRIVAAESGVDLAYPAADTNLDA